MESYLNLLEESFPGIKSNILHCESLGFKWGEEGRLFIKEENGKAISHVGYFETSGLIDDNWYKIGAIHGICTQSSYRNQGHASQLILEALQWAKKQCSMVILFTEIPKFYTRLFFQEIYPRGFKNWFLATRKLAKFDDRKRPHISNIGSFTIVEFRCFGAAKNPIFESSWVYQNIDSIFLINIGTGVKY